jgi:hypothetical protein
MAGMDDVVEMYRWSDEVKRGRTRKKLEEIIPFFYNLRG